MPVFYALMLYENQQNTLNNNRFVYLVVTIAKAGPFVFAAVLFGPIWIRTMLLDGCRHLLCASISLCLHGSYALCCSGKHQCRSFCVVQSFSTHFGWVILLFFFVHFVLLFPLALLHHHLVHVVVVVDLFSLQNVEKVHLLYLMESLLFDDILCGLVCRKWQWNGEPLIRQSKGFRHSKRKRRKPSA